MESWDTALELIALTACSNPLMRHLSWLSLRTSSASMAPNTGRHAVRGCLPLLCGPCTTWRDAAPRRWGASSLPVSNGEATMTAPMRVSTGTVPRARTTKPRRGWTTQRACASPCPTSWSPSPCLRNSERWHARTRRRSPPSCCGPHPRPYTSWPPIRGASEAGVGWWACSIPGPAPSSPILPSTLALPEADALPMADGCPHAPRASSTSRRSPSSAVPRAAID